MLWLVTGTNVVNFNPQSVFKAWCLVKHRDNFTFLPPLRPCFRFKDIFFQLTPRCRVLLEKLTATRSVKRFPAFCRARTFVTVLTKVDPRPSVTFRNKFFYGEEFSAHCPPSRPELNKSALHGYILRIVFFLFSV
jgi:hypothetical protein